MIEFIEASVTASGIDGERTIIHPLTLRLREPRIALIGGNGSGKSTIARLCNGLVLPAQGRVLVSPPDSGLTLEPARDGAAVRRQVGFVFTNPAAQLVMPTALEDVALSLRRKIRDRGERDAAARAVLDRFGIADLAERSVHALSGGQQQLLALASVLAADPAILIADEPTTLLDLRNSRMISEVLCSLPQQLIVATHDLDLAERCDRVLVIDGGRVIRDSSSHGAGGQREVIEWYREQA